MPVLKEGAKGPAVAKLQEQLKQLGFKPGRIDGAFGPKTLAAVRAFQKSKKLKVDGLVGPKTTRALQLASPKQKTKEGKKSSAVPSGARKMIVNEAPTNLTFAAVCRIFPQTPVANIENNLPVVLKALSEAQLLDKQMILMALATIRAETGNFTPLSEFRSKYNTTPKGHPFNRYDNRKDLGNLGRPDGERFRGRGYIQLTGRSNYEQHGAAIGLGNQLIENPTLANDPEIAAKLLASFLKSKEQAIREALAVGDLKTARKLVNGGTHGLATFKLAYRTGVAALS